MANIKLQKLKAKEIEDRISSLKFYSDRFNDALDLLSEVEYKFCEDLWKNFACEKDLTMFFGKFELNNAINIEEEFHVLSDELRLIYEEIDLC
jgi:hypothetical protein